MGRITLAALILAIAAGVYWFWWSDQGANGPITLKGTISYAGMPGMDGTLKSNFTLQAVPNKIRSTADIQGQRISSIIDLKKKKMYVLNDAEKTYAVEEFDLVGMSQTEKQDKWENTWFSVLKQTADWDYIGNGEGKHFCNKQTLEGLPTELTGATKTATGASAAAAALAQEVSKNVKGEAWFTPGTRLGWRYFSTLNKLMRVRPNGTGQRDTAKRPQFKYVNLDFFPIPMKATVSLGPMRMQMEVDKLSRGKISKDVFEVPQDYRLDNSASAKGNTSVLPFSSVQNQRPPAPPAPSRTVRTPPRTPTRRVVIPRRTRTTST